MTLTTPSRRSVLRTAAWSVPAVTVATAAPTIATSPQPVVGPNLSITLIPTPSRTGNNLSIAGFDIVNTGTTATVGIVFTFTVPGAQISDLKAMGLSANGQFGITVAGFGSDTVVMNFPANFFGPNGNSVPGDPLNTFVPIELMTNAPAPKDLTVALLAANGGTGVTKTFTGV